MRHRKVIRTAAMYDGGGRESTRGAEYPRSNGNLREATSAVW